MGLFDMLKKNKENNTIKTTLQEQERKPFDVNYTYYENGMLQVDFQDNDSRITLGQFYDVTRLIICDENVELAGHKLYRCYVSWYGSSDVEYCDLRIERQSRRNVYTEILTEIDIGQINNPQYLTILMRGLLKQSRVESYISEGLKDNPDRPCGIYIGGIQKTGEGYRKVFDQDIGNIAHNTNEMKMRRVIHNNQEQSKRKSEIAKKKSQIAMLQGEIDAMSK